jgi:threonine dehydrogenase-like Zn-dependent dehydrogenase
MKAVVFHDIGDIRLDEVPDPVIEHPTDAIVRITTSAICGTDLHMIRGTMPGMKPGTILGHEGVGIVEELGSDVRNLRIGDRVVIPSSIACGVCSYCRAGYSAQCDNANPHGHLAGTAFFGGPEESGPFQGLQAERARIPFASVNLVKLPPTVSDERAILLSDIFPTGYFGAELANIHPGATIAVFGCGPVGQFAILSAKLLGAGRIFAVDRIPSRLELAIAQGAEVVDFEREDPVATILRLTGDIGVDRAIDAVGVDAEQPSHGPGKKKRRERAQLEAEVDEIVEKASPHGDLWRPGNAPSMALHWAVDCLAKAGTLSIVGVYASSQRGFPIGKAMEKNLTIRGGNCHHRKYIPHLIELVASGAVDPTTILTQEEELTSAIEAYESFDRRDDGWVKVALRAA